MQQRFPLGFWNYVDAADQDATAVADWDDCGMTLTMSPNYEPGKHDKARFVAILDEAYRRNIGIILRDNRTGWHGAAKDSYFSHLAIEIPGENASNQWLEAVSDDDYNRLP